MSDRLLDGRKGWTIFGTTVAIWLVHTVGFLALLGVFVAWGREPGSLNASAASQDLLIVLGLVAWYATGVVVWAWLSRGTGQPWTKGLAAALPFVGLIWALMIIAPIVRGAAPWQAVSGAWIRGSILVVIVTMSLTPIAMTVATVQQNQLEAAQQLEQERLAAPCDYERTPSTGTSLVVVGTHVLGSDDLAQGVARERKRFTEAALVNDPQIPRRVANDVLVDFLIQESDFVPVSNREVEKSPGSCMSLTREAFAASEGVDGLLKVAQEVRVVVDPSLGYWDKSKASVVRVDPRILDVDPDVSDPLQDKSANHEKDNSPKPDGGDGVPAADSEADDAGEDRVDVFYATRVDYGPGSLPDGEFEGLTWSADLCLTSEALLQDQYLNKVSLFFKEDGKRTKVDNAEATATKGGRCDEGGVNLIVSAEEPTPDDDLVDKGWTPCRDYVLRIPETPTFAATDVDMCVSVNAVTAGGGD